mmetsp:Transcript_26101/g.32018  ORF Transcript_26101/g.32018 Transcript_26101/m.32018 type:complete len:147 (-) Transcript_26101:55-495(-)
MSSTTKARRIERNEDYLAEKIVQIKYRTEKCLENGIEVTERLISLQLIQLWQCNEISEFGCFLKERLKFFIKTDGVHVDSDFKNIKGGQNKEDRYLHECIDLYCWLLVAYMGLDYVCNHAGKIRINNLTLDLYDYFNEDSTTDESY